MAGLAARVFREAAEAALCATPLFKDLEPRRRAAVAPLFKLESVEANEAVFLEGDVPDKLYILLNGSVDLIKDGMHVASLDGATTLVGDGHPFFGAAAVLGGGRRPWDVFTRTHSLLLVLTVRSFRPFLRSVPEFRERLAEYAETRRRNWELETGRTLTVGERTEQDAVEEAAVELQRGVRGMMARRSYSEARERAVAERTKSRRKAGLRLAGRGTFSTSIAKSDAASQDHEQAAQPP